MEDKISFVQSDLLAIYKQSDTPVKRNKDKDTFYYILILLEGNCELKYTNRIHILKPNDMLIANRKEKFDISFNNKQTEFIDICFTSKPIHKFDENYDLLKPFYNFQQLKVINNINSHPMIKNAVNSLLKSLKTKSSRAFVFTSLLQILCELNYLYETKTQVKIKETDSSFAKISYYIDNNLFENITLKKLASGVFLSERCVCDTIKRHSGMTYRRYIASEKMKEARRLMYNSSESLLKIANILGFNTYSTFYRTYMDIYGVTPVVDREKIKNSKERPE